MKQHNEIVDEVDELVWLESGPYEAIDPPKLTSKNRIKGVDFLLGEIPFSEIYKFKYKRFTIKFPKFNKVGEIK